MDSDVRIELHMYTQCFKFGEYFHRVLLSERLPQGRFMCRRKETSLNVASRSPVLKACLKHPANTALLVVRPLFYFFDLAIKQQGSDLVDAKVYIYTQWACTSLQL